MRKLLLASAAVVGASAWMVGMASAQPVVAVPLAPPQMKVLQSESFGKSANDNNNYQAAQLPGAVANPTPGTMVVRLNGKLWSEIGIGGGSGFIGTGTGAGQKLAPYSIGTYFRLYPGVDAMATNGLRYGAQAEIRENFVGANSSTANQSSGLTSGQTLYVRRAFVYVGGANWGLIRMGQTDGVTGIFDNGTTTGQGVGQGMWNGDAPIMVAGNAVTFPWFTQQGAEYGSNKIVYLSPQFAGFDFGFHWAPNNGNQEFCGCAAGATAPNLSSTITPPSGARFTNMYVAGARYQGTFGPVGVYGFGSYIGSGHVNYNGSAAAAILTEGGPSAVAGSRYTGNFKNLSAGFGGVEFTVAGFSFGGAVQGGQYNGVMAPEPQGGVGAVAWGANVMYSTGPYTIGTTYYQYDSQGGVGLAGLTQRHEDALGVGANYQAAPGLQFYAEYLYGQRHQGGFDLNNGKYVGQVGYAGNNDVHMQALLVGTLVGW